MSWLFLHMNDRLSAWRGTGTHLLSQATSSQVRAGSNSDATYSLIPEPPAEVLMRPDSFGLWKLAILRARQHIDTQLEPLTTR